MDENLKYSILEALKDCEYEDIDAGPSLRLLIKGYLSKEIADCTKMLVDEGYLISRPAPQKDAYGSYRTFCRGITSKGLEYLENSGVV
ncbi:MAG: hypothetical protein N5P05_004434 (plasmid) [Chroococcopsis gigantea SAG 12.99]|jgi:hypothetical protein|nr:hypothetical protein [Chlorogloea purpurea SAG 13.99]MDV3002779.1 hypothetical protein [Chroococcopsis gigantea SAG 12.99]